MREQRDRWFATFAFLVMLVIVSLALVMQLVRARPSADPASIDETQTVQARIVRVIRSDTTPAGRSVELEFTSGPWSGQRAQIEDEEGHPTGDSADYGPGDSVLVSVMPREDGSQLVMISDYVRTGALAFFAALFVGLTILISGWKGIRSLIGLAISFLVLMGFVLPQILSGHDPVLVSVTGAFVLLAATLYLTQGWTLKTHSALLGILFSLICIGVLSTAAVGMARLTGFGSEDAMLLMTGTTINPRGLLLAGMIVGTLGVLDDVVISQASAVMELAAANPAFNWRELYRRAMNIGHDHIAATVNTLVLAYVGASMPLMLLFQLYPEPWSITMNRELLAEEILRTLVGSIGLLAAVPITTFATSLLHRRSTPQAVPVPTDPESLS